MTKSVSIYFKKEEEELVESLYRDKTCSVGSFVKKCLLLWYYKDNFEDIINKLYKKIQEEN